MRQAVAVAADESVPVRTECDALDLDVSAEGCPDGLPGVDVPEPYGLVVACGGDAVAVRAVGDAVYDVFVAAQGAPMGCAVWASQIRTVLSLLAVAMRPPSGL